MPEDDCQKMIARVVIKTLQIKVLLSTVTVQDLLPEFVQYGNMTLKGVCCKFVNIYFIFLMYNHTMFVS